MPPTSAPPSFYSNIAAMGQGGAPSMGKKPGPDGKNDDAELMQAFSGIFKVFEKIKKLKPEAGPKLQPAYDAIKSVIVDVLKKDPKEVEPAPETSAPPTPPAGNEPPPPPADGGDESHTA
jgi:hypothetical protein